MKLAGAILLLCATTLQGQSLDRTLAAMGDAKASSAALSAQLIGEMSRMAPADRRPARETLAGFANEFTAALIGRTLTRGQKLMLEIAMAQIVSVSGTNLQPAAILRSTLSSAGVSQRRTQRIITSFIAIGEEVRGPDDFGVVPVAAPQPHSGK